MGRVAAIVAREIREALPPTIFFLFLLHMIGLTKAVAEGDYRFTALRAAGATVGALLIAKAILVVEALPLSRPSTGRRAVHVLWKTLLYGLVVLAFRLAEEMVPLVVKHRGVAAAARAMSSEVSWPMFGVLALWILGGLFLYCLASELVGALGRDRVRALLFGKDVDSGTRPAGA